MPILFERHKHGSLSDGSIKSYNYTLKGNTLMCNGDRLKLEYVLAWLGEDQNDSITIKLGETNLFSKAFYPNGGIMILHLTVVRIDQDHIFCYSTVDEKRTSTSTITEIDQLEATEHVYQDVELIHEITGSPVIRCAEYFYQPAI